MRLHDTILPRRISTVIYTCTRFYLPLHKHLPYGHNKSRYSDETSWEVMFEAFRGSHYRGEQAKGHLYSTCGRIVEKPEEVLLITAWQTREDLRDFMNSAAYAPYLRALGATNLNYVPHTIIDLGLRSPRDLDGWTAIFTLRFDTEVSPEQRDMIMRMRGVDYQIIGPAPKTGWCGTRGSSGVKYLIPGFLPSLQSDNDSSADTAMLFQVWTGEWMEALFKDKYKCKMEKWDREMAELGPSSILQEHCFFKKVFSGPAPTRNLMARTKDLEEERERKRERARTARRTTTRTSPYNLRKKRAISTSRTKVGTSHYNLRKRTVV